MKMPFRLSRIRPYSVYAIFFLIFILGSAIWYRFSERSLVVFPFQEGVLHSAKKIEFQNPLDGAAVNSQEETSVRAVGIMIDNHVDAWPQSGVSRAKIVYEAMVEGGITRYFAIFDSAQEVAEVGPVRSARLYFLDWIQEYGDGLYVHSGGSPQALAAIKPRKIFDANEFFWGQYFWRGTHHFAPHNLFISSKNWQAMLDRRANSSSLFTADMAWKFDQDVGSSVASSSELQITFSVGYTIAWKYDSATMQYQRSINSKNERDRDGSEVWARNIIVQVTSVEDIANDDKGRQEIKTVGSGEATILRKGEVVHGTWEKKSLSGRTRFYDANGQEIVLTPGNTWIEVVDKNMKVSAANSSP
ncbi:MAG: DUF3048 domain-containing protein [Candidatus Magasanikbacteria bacterium]|nr:DUF3048 domain-containing protein [Candidatus Magasanikbacteria bacterium]